MRERTASCCNCLACQQRTGSVFAVLASFTTPFKVVGEATEYVRTGDQGAQFRFRFCPVCGSEYECLRHPWVVLSAGVRAYEKDP